MNNTDYPQGQPVELESVNAPEDFAEALDIANVFEYMVGEQEFAERWESAQGSSAISAHIAARFQKGGLLDAYGRGDFTTRRIICKMLARYALEQGYKNAKAKTEV